MNATDVSTAPTGIDCHYYTADDVGKTRDFYRDVVGLTVARDYMDGTFVEFDLGDGSTFALGPPHGERIMCSGIMFAVADVAAATEKVRASGATVHTDTTETPVCFVAVCEDPAGNTFMLHRRKAT